MTINSEQDKALLKQLIPINSLTDEHLEQICKQVVVENAKDGNFLFREGDNDNWYMFLLQGRIKLLSGIKEVAIIRSGTSNASFALAHIRPRTRSCQAIGDVRFVRIDSVLLQTSIIKSVNSRTNPEDADTDWMTLVMQARVFQQIPPYNMQHVLRRMEEVPIKAGESIIHQGEAAEYFYVMARGAGVITKSDPSGVRQLAILTGGDAFGEDALISGDTRSTTITMFIDGVLARLNKNDFSDLIRRPLVQSIRLNKAKPLVKQGAVWLDIQSAEDHARDHLPGAVNLPLEFIRERYKTLPNDKNYIVYGLASDSAVATFLLRERGFDVFMLEGWEPSDAPPAEPEAVVPAPVTKPAVVLDSAEQSKTVDPIPIATVAKLDTQVQASQSPESEKQLALYQKKLLQQVTTIRKLEQEVKDLTAANLRLKQLSQQSTTSSTDSTNANNEEIASLKQYIIKLEQSKLELQQELDMAQEFINDAAAQESSGAWEQLRTQKKLDDAERDLMALREENEQLKSKLK